MDKIAFMKQLAEITEEPLEKLKETTELESLECWDSLAKVSFVAFAASEYGVSIFAEDVMNAITVANLIALIENKLPQA